MKIRLIAVILALPGLAAAAPWSFEASMFGGVPGEPAGNDLLGSALALDGDTLAVGAFSDDIELVPGEGDSSTVGSVYVFRRAASQWVLEQRLIAADAQSGAMFGTSLALQGDRLVIGARGQDTPPPSGGSPLSDQGAAYVYLRQGTSWQLEAVLTPVQPLGALAEFGWSVSLHADRIAVGAPGVMGGVADVYRLEGQDWVFEQRVVKPADVGFGGPNAFGRALALDGSSLLVGAPLEDNPPFTHGDAGAAYVFVRSGTLWSLQARLVPQTPQPAAAFATAVALQLDEALVGTPFESEAALSSAGAAYRFTRSGSTWSASIRVTDQPPMENALFGQAVTLLLPLAAVGAPWSTGPLGFQQGEVQLFELDGPGLTPGQRLRAPVATAAAFNQFGSALAASGTALAVGEPRYTEVSYNDGAAHVFRNDPDRLFADSFESLP